MKYARLVLFGVAYVMWHFSSFDSSVAAPLPNLIAPQPFVGSERDYTGVFRFEHGETVVVAFLDDQNALIMLNLKSGEARVLQSVAADRFSYGPRALATTPVVGELRFLRIADGTVSGAELRVGQQKSTAVRLPMRTAELRFKNGTASLVGTLLLPAGAGPFAVAVVLHGAGPETRWSSFHVALPLLDRGMGAFIYDKRNSGESRGEPLPPSYYDSSLVLAEDAVSAVEAVKRQRGVNPAHVGVIGWSQGGWIGAIVAAKEPSTAFYVNVAGNASPGVGQWRHSLNVSMADAGFSNSDIEAANRYVTAFFDVAAGSISWENYQAALTVAKRQAWFTQFIKLQNTTVWTSVEQAQARWKDEQRNVPASDFSRVHVPTLGIFFGLDDSTTPESPSIFRAALEAARNPDFRVVEFPGLDHGGFEVPKRTHSIRDIDKMNPELFSLLTTWIADRVRTSR